MTIRTLDAEIAFPAQCELAEGPVWDVARGLLRWVDSLPGDVHALAPDSGDPCRRYRLSPDGAVTELFDGVGLSNGLDWSGDRRLFYYSDSHAGVDVFDTDPDTGALSGRRRLAEVSGGVPDGLTLDAEG